MMISLKVDGDPRIALHEDAQEAVPLITENASPPYAGDYLVTPTTTEQVLMTGGTYLKDHIHVAAIPSNYGLIGWNGSVLTVS